MIDIAAHISKLVREHELVIIPGLGGFLTNFHTSAIHALSNRVEPPGRHIAFNTKLKENDGLLAQYFAKIGNISYKDSLNLVETFAEFCKLELQSGRNISFENLGILSQNTNGFIEFTPNLSVNFADEYFGLPDIIAHRIQRNKQYKPVIQLHPEAKEKIQKNAPIIRKIAAVAIPFIVLGLLAFFTKDHIKTVYQQPAAIINLNTDSAEPIDENNDHTTTKFIENENANSSETESNIQAKDSLAEESSELILDDSPSLPAGNYHVICGAFSEKKHADALMDKLQLDGFKPYIAGQNDIGLYRVSFANFNNRTKAVDQLRWFQANRNKEAWLLDLDL